METGIKWPNDIVMNKKKVCGILTEMSTEIDYINYVVIGVGINVNQKAFDEELKEKATSLMIETGAPVKRSALIAAVMKHFEKIMHFLWKMVICPDYRRVIMRCL